MTIGCLVFAIAALLFALMGAEPVAACNNQNFVGVWENPEARDKDVTRIEIVQDCRFSRKGSWLAKAETIWTIRAWSRCRPRDCTWGRSLGRKEESGPLTAIFETFSATRYVELEASGKDLNLRYKIDFSSASRKDISGIVQLTRVN